MKTSELTGAALDWAVAKCEGATDFWFDTVATYWVKLNGEDRALRYGWAQAYLPSTDWSQGGPIIEREGIDLECHLGYWASSLWPNKPTTVTPVNAAKYRIGRIKLSIRANGPTPLIAAMRCYVASKLGDDVEVPEAICNQ